MTNQFSFSDLSGDKNTVENVFRLLRGELEHISRITPGEATSLARLIFHALKGWDTTQLFSHYPDPLSDFTLQRIDEIMGRMKKDEPIQYILGEARFYGMDLAVDRSTLIPRHETEELVELIVNAEGRTPDLRVLDAGTGSGAIGIALSRNLLFPDITAIDISPDALRIARQNAEKLHASIRFLEQDIFSYNPAKDSFDIIVSNPPYIARSESVEMTPDVLDYEPHSALFVSDEDPLIFYRRIAEVGLAALSSGGRLYFEINPLFADRLKKKIEEMGYTQVTLHKDISGRQRFLSALIPTP